MPIYRGDRLVTPRPGGQSVARVYRGDRLVWQAGPTHIASGQFSGVVSNTEVRYFDQYTFLEGGVFTIEAESPPGTLRRLALEGPWGETLGATDLGSGTATVSTTAALSAGQVVRFGAVGSNGATVSGTWTITPAPPLTPVTPVAPTFHDGEPWITLPTVEGVTYSVSGTPGYDASVTVTASAQPGYELVGTASWSHTFGPPPRYTASNSGGSGRVNSNSWTTITSHTVSSDGVAGGTWTFEWSNYLSTAHTAQTRVQRNGQTIASDVRTRGGNIVHNVNIPETQLNTGDTITFQSHLDTTNSAQREYSSWSWSLS